MTMMMMLGPDIVGTGSFTICYACFVFILGTKSKGSTRLILGLETLFDT